VVGTQVGCSGPLFGEVCLVRMIQILSELSCLPRLPAQTLGSERGLVVRVRLKLSTRQQNHDEGYWAINGLKQSNLSKKIEKSFSAFLSESIYSTCAADWKPFSKDDPNLGNFQSVHKNELLMKISERSRNLIRFRGVGISLPSDA
jgi:hypothetical protein